MLFSATEQAAGGEDGEGKDSSSTDPTFINNLGFADPYGSTSKAVNALFTAGERKASNRMVIVRVGAESPLLGETLEVLGRGECGTASTAPDPLLDWVFSGNVESNCRPLGGPPSKGRQAWFRWMATYCAYFALARGGLYALVDPRTGKVLAAAATGPPKTVSFGRMSGGEMGDNIRTAGMQIGQDVLATGAGCLRMRALGTWQHGVQESQGLGKTNHLYVVMLATAPEAQGKGCGKALLQFLGEVADADGAVAFLETAGVRNCAFYAKGGYEEVARSPVAGFTHGGGGVGMRRIPAAQRGVPRADGGAAPQREAARPTCSFSAKRAAGPLSSYCRTCDGHRSAHGGVA
jgi:GNAT superfamily N-acetyltransferase